MRIAPCRLQPCQIITFVRWSTRRSFYHTMTKNLADLGMFLCEVLGEQLQHACLVDVSREV